MTRSGAPQGGAFAAAAQSNHGETTPAEREVGERLHSAAVVLAAIDCGAWPAAVKIIDGVAALLEQASRWQMVAELGEAA